MKHCLMVFAACGALVLTGCGGDEPQSSGGVDQIELTVSHYPSTLHSVPFVVAQQKGFFTKQRIKVTRVIGSAGGGTTTRNLLAGHTEFGVVALPSIVQAFQTGAPLKVLAGGSDNLDELHFIQRKDEHFEKPEDMVGHVWGYTSPASVTDSASRLIFKKAGVDLGQVDFKAAGGISEGLTLLKEGELDATPLDDPTFTIQKDQWKDLVAVADYIDKIQQDAIVTSPQLIQSDPDLVKRFLAALEGANQWLYAHPDDAGRLFAKQAGVEEAAAVTAVRNQAKSRRWSLALSKEGIDTMIEGAQLAGALKKGEPIAWNELLNQDYLPAGVAKVDPKALPDYGTDDE